MALKGFLASGFQKLIGASRIKGANNQWVGEPNVQGLTLVSNQITNTLFFGHNVLLHSGISDSNVSGQLLASTPTFDCSMTVINQGNKDLRFVRGAGSGQLDSVTFTIKPLESATLFYSSGIARWYTTGTTDPYQYITSYNITNGQTAIVINEGKSWQRLDIFAAGSNVAASLTTMTGQASNNIITLYGGIGIWDSTVDLKLIASTSPTPATNAFVLNGDFSFQRYSSITLTRDGSVWVETSRTSMMGV
jgi:hypothetical protein